MAEKKYVLKYKDFKAQSSNPFSLKYYKLVGDKVEQLADEDDMNEVYNKERLFNTDLKVFNLSANISTVFLPIPTDLSLDEPLIFETMIFSDIEDLNCKYSKRATSLKNALHDHYDLASLAFGYLKGRHDTNKFKKIRK